VPDGLIHPHEKPIFIAALTVSIFFYLLCIVSIVFLVYLPFVVAFLVISQGLALGHLRGNAVRVTPAQFPDLYAIAERTAGRMGLAVMPAIYVVQEGGFLNAFAVRFFGRDFMVVYAEAYLVAKQQGEAELAFIVAHEMAHLQRRHTLKKALTYPAAFVPFLGPAYSRACEYTADAIGAACEPAGAANSMLLLASGRHLYRSVDGNVFLAQDVHDRDGWVVVAELFASHPTLPKRLGAIARQLAAPPVPTPANAAYARASLPSPLP